MAAVICQAFGEACNGMNKVLCLPCKACNLGCESMCEVIWTPFFPYIATTFLLNIPGIVYGLRGLGASDGGDCQPLATWLIWNGVLALAHIIASMYIVQRIREETGSALLPATTGVDNSNNDASTKVEEGAYMNPKFWAPRSDRNESQGPENTLQRIKHVLCYDKIVAIYIVAFIVWIVWLGVGFTRRVEFGGGECDRELGYMNFAIMCGYIYLTMVGVAFICSLCCLR